MEKLFMTANSVSKKVFKIDVYDCTCLEKNCFFVLLFYFIQKKSFGVILVTSIWF